MDTVVKHDKLCISEMLTVSRIQETMHNKAL